MTKYTMHKYSPIYFVRKFYYLLRNELGVIQCSYLELTCCEAVWENGGMAPCIIYLGTTILYFRECIWPEQRG
jgi:hypothetical protein